MGRIVTHAAGRDERNGIRPVVPVAFEQSESRPALFARRAVRSETVLFEGRQSGVFQL